MLHGSIQNYTELHRECVPEYKNFYWNTHVMNRKKGAFGFLFSVKKNILSLSVKKKFEVLFFFRAEETQIFS